MNMAIAQGDSMSADQVLALAACMLSTAHVDGVHPQEVALIRQFYDGAGVPGLPPFAEVEGMGGKADGLLKKVAGDAGFAEQLVLLCFATGYADGALSDAERAHVEKIGTGAGLSAARVAELLQQVKDSLIGALSHLPDAGSVANLAREL
jgi:hypothetical protein